MLTYMLEQRRPLFVKGQLAYQADESLNEMEALYHPQNFKTKPCMVIHQGDPNFCPFYHDMSDSRSLQLAATYYRKKELP